ncbi:hypothetical protein DCE94_11000 [Agromyces badenianii]|nr:hypothetical protein DCE94_11000 [Agromyces badenianii]
MLETMLRPHTTFLIGRKGTGKSTVFQRAQFELRKKHNVATCYVDIKSVYESSRVDAEALASTTKYDGVLSGPAIERLWLNRDFFLAIIASIREEIEKKIKGSSVWSRLIERSAYASIKELFAELDDLLSDAKDAQFESVVGAVAQARKASNSTTSSSMAEVGTAVGARALGAEASLDARVSSEFGTADFHEVEQTEVLLRVFDLRKMIKQLRSLLTECGVSSLYVFLDDFSELPEPAMRVVVDALLAPLNNWSDELIKFKIAAYPGRIYFGAIDPTKVDEINLDLYSLYGAADLVAMEDKAVDFTRRLVLRRLDYFGAADLGQYVDSVNDDFWRQLFHASMANPRTLGYLLYFGYEEALIYGRRIGAGTIRDVARKYFEDKIQASFDMNRFLSESFKERSSIFSLKDLLEEIVDKARALRRSDASVFRDLGSRAPTSHFHVDTQMEGLLSSLELNFFVTKYYIMSDRDGRKVAVYALNYGLCQQQNIEFGRPAGTREKRYRQYYVERVFDYTPLMSSYLRHHQEIVCPSCDTRHDLDMLAALKTFGMMCPTCKGGPCQVVNLSKKYENALRDVEESSLLPQVELGILHSLATESSPLTASDVAGELDCSYQLVGKRVKNLDERGLVNRDQYEGGKRVYVTTPLAEAIYFGGSGAADGPSLPAVIPAVGGPNKSVQTKDEDWDF